MFKFNFKYGWFIYHMGLSSPFFNRDCKPLFASTHLHWLQLIPNHYSTYHWCPLQAITYHYFTIFYLSFTYHLPLSTSTIPQLPASRLSQYIAVSGHWMLPKHAARPPLCPELQAGCTAQQGWWDFEAVELPQRYMTKQAQSRPYECSYRSCYCVHQQSFRSWPPDKNIYSLRRKKTYKCVFILCSIYSFWLTQGIFSHGLVSPCRFPNRSRFRLQNWRRSRVAQTAPGKLRSH